MSNTSDNNKRIAKNTLMLYFRMIFLMLVSLYTSRIVLATLGEVDYGLYNVVGGVVVLLSFLNGSMAAATQRFLNFEMGRKNKEGLSKVFSTAITIHAIVALIVIVLAETIGLWFLNTFMNIPANRLYAANCVYQFSVISFIVTILSVPYNAAIIAHEKMSAFAYISILEAILKLAIAFLIQVLLFDKLITYGFLLLIVAISLRVIYGVYCNKHFEECHFRRSIVDKKLRKQMLSYSSWTIVGGLSSLLHTQGIAICINLFFNAAVNAAQGISNIVNSAVSGFVSNFQMALNPQIVQNYSAGKLQDMYLLVFRGCRFSFFLISFFAIPLIVEAPSVLGIWLKEVPEYTVIFVRLVLAISVINSYTGVMSTSQGATGKQKKYQITLISVAVAHVPLTIIAYYLGYPPQASSWIYIFIMLVQQSTRVYLVHNSIGFHLSSFMIKVVLPCLLVLALSAIVPVTLHHFWNGGFWVLATKCVISFLCTALIAFTLGMEKKEKQIILQTAKNRLRRL